MTIPVLAVNDPDAARHELARHFGFQPARPGIVLLGKQAISVVHIGEQPEGMIPLVLDHVALSVANADETYTQFSERGARLDRRFTPDGPREIPEFREHGVRFVFFEGPGRSPLEFCARLGADQANDTAGHDHYAIRTTDIERSQGELVTMGAVVIAEHQLRGATDIVNVRFLQFSDITLELFDEALPPASQRPGKGGWIGLIQTG